MKAETQTKKEIESFSKFIKDSLNTVLGEFPSHTPFGVITINGGTEEITYTTYSGMGKYTLRRNTVLFFEGRRRSFSDGIHSLGASYFPYNDNWEITETSMPELKLGDLNE